MGTGPLESVFGGNSIYRETWGTRRGGCHVTKNSSDLRQAYPEVKLYGRDLVRVVGIVGPFATMGVRYPGKIRFIEPQGGGGMGTGDVCRVPLAAVRHGRARQTSEL